MSSAAEQSERTTLLGKFATALGPELAAVLAQDDVTDVAINPDGSVFVERLGRPWTREDIRMGRARVSSLIKTVASLCEAVSYEHEPTIVEAVLADSGWRFEGLLPPAVDAPSVSIRKPATRVLPLSAYLDAGAISRRAYDALGHAIRDRQNVLVAGGTGSGKTTLANALLERLAAVHRDDRVVTIEDQPELRVLAPNTVSLRTAPRTTMQDLLRATLRMKPTRIVVGEVRGAEALVLIKAWNTGHPGGIATLHSNSAIDGLLRLEQLAAEGTRGFVPRSEVAAAVQTVAFIAQRNGKRRVEQVIHVSGLDAQGNYAWEETS